MSQSLRILVLVLVAVAVALKVDPGADRPQVVWTDRAELTDAARARTFRFDSSVTPYERQAFEAAVASARPEARRLIEAVDGLVSVSFGPTGADALGVTMASGPIVSVRVDLAAVQQRYGPRGIARVVLHELGHVLDFTVLEDDLRGQLDAGIPRGYGCEPGEPTGSCATREERFAESFAKWAMNDIGVDLYIGYKVPPPSMSLDDWGRPLASLAV